MKILSGAELFHSDGQTDRQRDRQKDRHDIANICFRNSVNVPNKQHVHNQVKHKFHIHKTSIRFIVCWDIDPFAK